MADGLDPEKGEANNWTAVTEKPSPPLDPNLVTWDGPNDPKNPRNWPVSKRWTTTLTVACFTLLSPLTSTMISPAVNVIGVDLHDRSAVHLELTLSIFLLGLGFGPLVLSPISEMHGRLPVLILGNIFFIIWNTASGFVHNTGQLMVFRLLAGLGASAPLAIGGGLLSDLWEPERRGQALAMYTSGPLLGPALGPIIGAYVTQHISWRWVFWVISVASGCFQLIALLFLNESYPPKLLANKAKKLRKETGNLALHTQYEEPDRTLPKLLRMNLIRPIKLLSTQIIIQILSLFLATLYGIMYLLLFTFPTLWTDIYHESVGIGSLNYLSTGLGFVIGSQATGYLNDMIYKRLTARNKGIGAPEFRIPLLVPGTIVIPIGLFWYGWTGEAQTHWILPNIGAFIFCFGTIMSMQVIQTYTIDSYPRYAASAISTINVAKSITGFGFPLFAPKMYNTLHYGWGNSLLAFISLAIGVVATPVLWKCGSKLRARSTYATGD